MLAKIRSKLGVKIFLSMVSVLISTFVIFFIAVNIFFPKFYGRALFGQLVGLVVELENELEGIPFIEVVDLITTFSMEHQANVMITHEDGSISIPGLNSWENQMEAFMSNFMFMDNEGANFLVDVEIPLTSIKQMTDIIVGIMTVVFGLGVFISIGVSFIYSYCITRPITSIIQVSRRISELDLSRRCDIRKSDEIGELAYYFNQMTDKLEQSFIDLQEANQNLYEKMEKEKYHERQRKDFFIAVSHELKTPITILKTELRGMIDNLGVYKERDLYLRKAYETADSMSELVQKLLKISQIKSNEIKLTMSRVNICELVNETCESYEELANVQRMALTYFCEDDIVCYLDKEQFKNVLSNLIANGILYSPKGEFVDIQLHKEGPNAILTIENYGARINQEDLEKLFEPFYRTDKSRNKHTGGSGLGLFIVKSILEMHEFSYELKNSEQGVLFTIMLPLHIEGN